MAKAKYLQIYEEMVKFNKKVFDEFSVAHGEFLQKGESAREAFDLCGKCVLDLVQKYENILCMDSQKSGYGNYTHNLSDKFWGVLRKSYPLIDKVGIKKGL